MPPFDVREIPLEEIHPDPQNRKIGGLNAERLEELADSIRAMGVQQPIIVRPTQNGHKPEIRYDLVAGERRWRASNIAGVETIPAIVRDLTDIQVLEIQTIENLQREDMHPLDECDGYHRLMERAGYTPEDLAAKVARSLPYIYQRLKLRNLIDPVRKMLADGEILVSHALLVAKLPQEQQVDVAEFMVQAVGYQDGITVGMVQNYMENNILMDLHTAGFSKSDPELIAQAGPCTVCSKRTGYQPALFPELGKRDLCMDAACFKWKLDAYFDAQMESTGDEKLVKIEKNYSRDEVNVLRHWQYDLPTAKADANAHGIIVDGPERGKIIPIIIRADSRFSGSQGLTEEQKNAKAEFEKKKEILAERCRRTWDRVQNHIDADPDVFFENEVMLRFLVDATFERAWDDSRKKLCKIRAWEIEKREDEYSFGAAMNRALHANMTKMSASELKHLLIDIVLVQDYDQGGPYGGGPGIMKPFAALLQIDVEEIEREIRAERAAAAE